MNIMNTGIYAIRNTTNDKRYVGSAKSFQYRFSKHKTELRKGNHHSIKLQRAWNKYGSENFVFEKLIICSKENLLMYEQIAIDSFDAANAGYNICLTAGSNLGMKFSDEHRMKMSISLKGRKHSDETKKKIGDAGRGRIASEETRKKMSIALTGKKYGPLPEEQKAKISKTLTGRKLPPFSEEHKKNISIGQRGKKMPPTTDQTRLINSIAQKKRWAEMSPEKREEMRISLSGRVCSEETKLKISTANSGKKHSQEQIDKNSLGHIGLKATEETKLKMSEAQKIRWEKRKVAKLLEMK